MKIFIDESGSFTGFHEGSISAVGTLAIPNGKIDFLTKKYAKLRLQLPKENGEVKGRLLSEAQIDEIVTLLARNETLFEATIIDLGMQTEEEIQAYKTRHGNEMLAKVKDFAEAHQVDIERASRQILTTSTPLYLQALMTFEVIHRTIANTTAYYSQRRPQELGTFEWVVDGKDKLAVTRWEMWWSQYAQGALATMSKRRPMGRMPMGNYTYYDKGFGSVDEKGEKGTDLKLLLKAVRFSSKSEPGLEFIDILSNAIRRALNGNLQRNGWINLRKLMVHRNNDAYIQFILLRDGADVFQRAAYANTVHEGFRTGGKPMLTPRSSRLASEEIKARQAIKGK